MSRSDDKKRFGNMLATARINSGKSQEYMALELDVSRKTIYNWENGSSSPTLRQLEDWFHTLGLNPVRYVYSYLYPSLFDDAMNDDDKVMDSLCKIVIDLPTVSKRQLLFLLSGYHGSSPIAKLQEITADLQTPMPCRYYVARMIEENYMLAKEKDVITCKDNIQPNLEVFHECILKGRNAIIEGKNEY